MSPPPTDTENKGSMGQSRTDLLLLNARVLDLHSPPNASLSIRQAVAIGSGRIISVGRNDEVSASVGPAARVIDCNGMTLMPGLVDSHCHLLALGSTLRGLDCGPQATSSIPALQQLVRRRADLTLPGGWIRGFGYDDNALAERRHPNRWDLDTIAGGHPVWLDHRSRHASVLNSRGLELLGITSETPDPVEGVIDRTPRRGLQPAFCLKWMVFCAADWTPPTTRRCYKKESGCSTKNCWRTASLRRTMPDPATTYSGGKPSGSCDHRGSCPAA